MKTYIYLREYPEQEKIELYDLLQSSIEKLPFTLASPIEKLTGEIERENYGKAMNYTLDFFEITVQYLSCLLLVLIQKEEKHSDKKHKELIRVIDKIDKKRPLSFGDWINDIFFPLLKAANDIIPENELVISLNKYLISKGGNLLTGTKKEPSIVQIRNEYRGHSTTLSEDIYKGVVYTLEPRIFRMLKAIAPLGQWIYFSCNRQITPDKYRITLLNGFGLNKEKEIETTRSLEPYHYYVWQGQTETDSADLIDLFPLLFCNEKNYVYVFQTLREEYISYISSNEHAVTYIDDLWNEAFDKRLQLSYPAFDIAKELNWGEIRNLTDRASRKFLEHAYKEKKYNRELFVDRTRLSAFFQDFQISDKLLFPLLGEAGQGKTNQLCYWTEKLMEGHKGVLIFNSTGFTESTLEERLKSIFGFNPRKSVKKLLDNIHKRAIGNGENIYFLFDAINECLSYKGASHQAEGPLNLYQDICSLLVSEEYPCFKVLFTCRSYTWKNLIQPHISREELFTFQTKNDEEIAVRGFTDKELEKAYEIYGELYQMSTPFASLFRGAGIRMKDPLVLKIVCTNYLGMELPDSMLSYTSISLFEKMLRDISHSYAGNKQCTILKELAHFILQEYEKGVPADSISEGALRGAYNQEDSPLHLMAGLIYKKDDISVAYGELLNKPERPILRLVEDDNGEGHLQFIYERFLEFMLALVFTEREIEKLQNKEENIPADIFVKALRYSNTNVVFMGAMRNALIMDYMRTGSYSVILQLVSGFGDDYEIMLLITETLDVLIRENYESQLFALLDQLLCQQPAGGEELIRNFNTVDKKIESNQADDEVIREHNRLYKLLAPVIRLRKLASVSTVNGIFLTDYFHEGLYRDNPYRLLWKLVADPINDVRNDACLCIYYLSNKTHTLDYSVLEENLALRIVQEMYGILRNNAILKIAVVKQLRGQAVIFLETATRLSTLLIIDAVLAQTEDGKEQVELLLDEIRAVLRHFTANFTLLRVMMPFFQIILRRQITFQSIYVNNAIEYQTFWDDAVMPLKSNKENEWCRETMKEILVFIFHYNRYYKNRAEIDTKKEEIPDFTNYHEKILSAYKKGDSFSYFALERLLVIMGTCTWDYIRPIVNRFFTEEYRCTEWFDYSQMSMLYILFQVSVNASEANEEIISIYSRECDDWTRRCKGLFKGRNSHKANPTKHYKRNVMNWYCVVYCRHTGDGNIRLGDDRCVPVFYQMLDDAISRKDKELLYHLLENISELVTDYGYITTTLELLKYIFIQFDSMEKVTAFDEIELERGGVYQDSLITFIGKVLSTAKNCFPTEVDNFIKKDMIGLKFPGVSKYRGDILNYNSSGETLSDLLTHRFGNFLMWTLLNEEAVDRFAYEAMAVSTDSSHCFQWYDQVVRILFRDLFRVKL